MSLCQENAGKIKDERKNRTSGLDSLRESYQDESTIEKSRRDD
jgi:hypothetical protein